MEMINNNVVNFPQLPEAASQVKPAPDVPKEVAAASNGASAQDSTTNDDTGGATSGGQGKTPYYELRLTIDKDPQTGGWVYKAINRYTGEVVSQMPHQTAAELQKSEAYQAGSVITTQA